MMLYRLNYRNCHVLSEVLQTSFELKPSSTQIRRSGSSSQHLNQWPQIQPKLSILVALEFFLEALLLRQAATSYEDV